MSKIRQEEKKQPAPYGTVAKLQWLRVIAKRSEFSRTTLAACCVIADMADSKSGVCWPSFSYLADACGTSIRHIKKSINQATENNLVTIAEHGNRVRSNRYRINLDLLGSDLQDTTHGGDPQDTRVVISRAEGSDLQVPDVVIHRSPESIHPTEHQAREGWDRSLTEGGVRSLRADRPTLSRQAGRYDEFWEALGKRSTVYESEQLITEFIADGVDYADIIDGAKKWRAYNDVTGGRHAASPLKWLENRKWLDDWELPAAKAKAESKRTKKSSKAKQPIFLEDGSVVIPDHENDPECIEWERSAAELVSAEEFARVKFSNHFEQCPNCVEHQDRHRDLEILKEHDRDYLCQSCLDLHEEYREASEIYIEFFDKGKKEWKFLSGATVSAENWEEV